MRFIIGGGGTGGHLAPGIAVYETLKSLGDQTIYVLRKQDLIYDMVQKINTNDRIMVDISGISRRLSWNTPQQIGKIFSAWLQTFSQIKNFKPDAVIITGGYVSNIPAFAAVLLRIPLFILEQNSVAGITNRFWAKFAMKVFTAFPHVQKIPQSKIIFSGNPILYSEKIDRLTACSFFDLANANKILGISGGSQGAKVINNALFEIIPQIIKNNISIIWSLGAKEFDRFLEEGKIAFLQQHFSEYVKIYRFITRMDMFWSACDAIVARSGAGTVSESLFFQVPALFIPIHRSPDNHQALNAYFLKDAGAALCLNESTMTTEELLNEILILFSDMKNFKASFPTIPKNSTCTITNTIKRLLEPAKH